LRRRARKPALDRAIRQLAHPQCARLWAPLAREMVYGWGNELMSASEEFLQAIFHHASASRGPILECGSGLSTLVLGMAAQRAGQCVYSLEDSAEWAKVVRSALRRYKIDSVKLCLSPLREYGDYEWYDPPQEILPGSFALVVCDGPQGTAHGGRYGLMPVLGEQLRSGCVVLLDDASRTSEQAVLARWDDELHISHEIFGKSKPYARLCMPSVY
jgi:hypothetical protein